MNRYLTLALLVVVLLSPAPAFGQTVVDLDDLSLPPNSFYNGSDGAGQFISRGAVFNNVYDSTFDVWSGWAYSNMTDVTTAGFTNQYSAYHLPNGGGDAGSPNFAVAFCFSAGDSTILLPSGTTPVSVRLTNNTYAALSMRDGDSFSKKFGGASGNDPDFFRVTITGLDGVNQVTGSVVFYLADYRFANNSLDYIISSWTPVDLTPLGARRRLSFGLESSDTGSLGMNTPAYFALDSLQLAVVPEPATLGLVAVGAVAGFVAYRRRRPVTP